MNSNVLFVTGEYPPMQGGVGDYTERLVGALRAASWTPAVLTGREAARDSYGVYADIERWNWRLPGNVQRVAAQAGAAIVHIQYQTGAFGMHPAINLLPWLLRRDTGLMTVTTFHDLRQPYLFPKAGVVRPLVNRLLASGSDAVVVTNPEDRRQLVRAHGFDSKVHQIPIGSNLPEQAVVDRASVLSPLGIRPGDQVVGFFGFPTPDKGIELLLRALADFGTGAPRLILIGGEHAGTVRGNRDYADVLYQQVRQLHPAPVITGHLPQQQAATILASVDLIALPFRKGASLRNGSLLAALASGRPVITTAPSHPEDLLPFRDRDSLWLVPPGDAPALGRVIREVLNAESNYSQVSARARLNLAGHAWESIAQSHIDLYESLLHRRSPRVSG